MQIAFPGNIRIRNMHPRLEGLRHTPFVNIDGEAFARPSLNGFWRVGMTLLASNEDEYLALTSFLTSMRGHATTVLPMTTRWLPNDGNGRQIKGFGHAPEFLLDNMGFQNEPFVGFVLRAPARHRDSYIDVIKPDLSHLRPGHFITLGDRLHQVVSVSAINESDRAVRVSIRPSVRGNHDAGSLVVVDHLKLRAQLESADDPEISGLPITEVTATFLESFAAITAAAPTLPVADEDAEGTDYVAIYNEAKSPTLPVPEPGGTPFDFVSIYEQAKQ